MTDGVLIEVQWLDIKDSRSERNYDCVLVAGYYLKTKPKTYWLPLHQTHSSGYSFMIVPFSVSQNNLKLSIAELILLKISGEFT